LDDIKNIFAVADVPIETEDKVLTFPTCIYKWEDGQVFSIKEMAGQLHYAPSVRQLKGIP